MFSVRTRITAVAALVSGTTLVMASWLLVAELDRSETHSADNVSRARLQELAVLAEHGGLRKDLGDAGDGVVQAVAGDGTVIAASTNVVGKAPITRFQPTGGRPPFEIVRGAPDDTETEDYRVWAKRVRTDRGLVTLYVGRSLESVREATATVQRALLVGVPVTLGVLVAATWWLVGRALRPVERIRAEVAGITAAGLDRRVPVPRTRDEVGNLARTMNEMLDRLHLARRREQDFVADASHELLSPLAASRVMLEVEPDASTLKWDELRSGLLAENASMEHIVRDLLFLAHDPPLLSTYAPVDLDDIVLEEAARLRTVSILHVDTKNVSAGPVHGSADELRRLVRNLVENAGRYAAGNVRLELRTRDEHVYLHVIDDGPGIEPADRDRVFDRFFRTDTARTRSADGTGLGLAIARAIAERHDGTLALSLEEGGAHLVITLPRDHG